MIPLLIPGPGTRDAYSRRADTWPRHRARARQRQHYRVTERKQQHLHRAQQARRARSLYRGGEAAAA